MMTGIVNADLEALLVVTLRDSAGQPHDVEAVVDTGFNGFLTLPAALIARLGLRWLCRQQGQLADGTFHPFDVYVAKADWHGRSCDLEVEAADAQPLLGMSLLQGSELRVQVMRGGSVVVGSLP